MEKDSVQGKVGRMLSAERVKLLNSQDWFNQMLKDNPNISDIYPGIENEILVGAIDHHIHAYPDFVHRAQSMIQVAMDAARAGMRAIVFKDHFFPSAGAAYAVHEHINCLVEVGELGKCVEVYGGLGLNLGMNPEAVRSALRYPHMKMLWFPTFNSVGSHRASGKEGGVPLVDNRGRVLPEVEEIIRMAAEAGVGIGLGHTDYQELRPVAEKIKEIGARAVLDHPLLELNRLTLDEIEDLVGLGIYVGIYSQPVLPSIYQPITDPLETIEAVKLVGAERCILAGDFGQVLHLDFLAGMRVFIRALLAFGVTKEEIQVMYRDNPAKLLYLEN